MRFAKMEEGWEWEWTQQDHLEEVIITPENTHTYLQVTHRIIEIVELVIESIKVDIILLINHLGSYHLYLDKWFSKIQILVNTGKSKTLTYPNIIRN